MPANIAEGYTFEGETLQRLVALVAARVDPKTDGWHIAIAIVDVNGDVVASVGLNRATSVKVELAEEAAKDAMDGFRWTGKTTSLQGTTIQDGATKDVIGAIAVVGAPIARAHQLAQLCATVGSPR